MLDSLSSSWVDVKRHDPIVGRILVRQHIETRAIVRDVVEHEQELRRNRNPCHAGRHTLVQRRYVVAMLVVRVLRVRQDTPRAIVRHIAVPHGAACLWVTVDDKDVV